MNNVKDALNWAQGFERYTNSKYILDSSSWEEAQNKIDNILNVEKARGNHTVLYYEVEDNTLWNEYRFLFLCQFLEFKTAEFFSKLEGEGKVKQEFILKLKKDKKANTERASSADNKRILSPASLISDLGFNLGDLVVELERSTSNFGNKEKLLNCLKKFNVHRISFTHHSFNTKKKAGDINLKDIILTGTKSGNEALKFL